MGSLHVFRQTFAHTYLAREGEVYKLSRLMGHTGIEITQIESPCPGAVSLMVFASETALSHFERRDHLTQDIHPKGIRPPAAQIRRNMHGYGVPALHTLNVLKGHMQRSIVRALGMVAFTCVVLLQKKTQDTRVFGDGQSCSFSRS